MRGIEIVVSNPLIFGRGHFTRQKQLASILSEAGFNVKIVLNDAFSETGQDMDFLVLDLADNDKPPSKSLMDEYKFVIGFDWCNDYHPDINFVILPHVGKEYPSRIRTYAGFEYLIIDSRFTSLTKQGKSNLEKFQLVSIGFSAKSENVKKVLDFATQVSELPIKVCVGTDLQFDSRDSVQILKNPAEYAQLVADSEIIYTNGASTLVEALLLRKRIVAFPQTTFEDFFLSEIENRLEIDLRFRDGRLDFVEYSAERIFDSGGGMRILEVLKGHLL